METSLPIDRPLAISPMPKEIDDVVTVSYRSGGLGIWGGYGVSYFYIPIVEDTVIYETYNDVDVLEIF